MKKHLEDGAPVTATAVELMLFAFRDLHHAMLSLTDTPPAEATAPVNIFAQGSPLSQIHGWQADKLNWLNLLDSVDFASGEFYALMEDAYDRLCDGIVRVRKWRWTHRAKLSERILRACAMLAQLGMLAFLAAVIIWGASEYFSRPGPKDGLAVTHYEKPEFKGHPFMWTDHATEFDWIDRPPVKFSRHRDFSSKWLGCIEVPAGNVSLLAETTETHLRVLVDGATIIDLAPGSGVAAQQSKLSGKTSFVSKISAPLTPGVHTIEIQSAQNRVPAQIHLRWKPKNGKPYAISHHALIAPGGNDIHQCPSFSKIISKSKQNGKKNVAHH
ncbi:MAG: hypothetical protein JXR76_14375 [Deltaproteobacteria bacterium]|nr:hypothetical protein [Deltaproteobacteria bacterium]